jgi:hypothetical protein
MKISHPLQPNSEKLVPNILACIVIDLQKPSAKSESGSNLGMYDVDWLTRMLVSSYEIKIPGIYLDLIGFFWQGYSLLQFRHSWQLLCSMHPSISVPQTSRRQAQLCPESPLYDVYEGPLTRILRRLTLFTSMMVAQRSEWNSLMATLLKTLSSWS